MVGKRRLGTTMSFLAGFGSVLAVCAAAAASPGAASPLAATTAETLERSTQALADAIVPGERSVWEKHDDGHRGPPRIAENAASRSAMRSPTASRPILKRTIDGLWFGKRRRRSKCGITRLMTPPQL
jgi:hypothetical protein